MAKPDEYYGTIIDSMDEEEAIEFVSARVKEAIEDTRRTRIKVERTLDEIDARRGMRPKIPSK